MPFSTPALCRGSHAPSPAATRGVYWIEGGLVVLDQRGRVVEVNPEFRRWSGEWGSFLKGRSFPKMLAAVCPDWAENWRTLNRARKIFTEAQWTLPAEDSAAARWFRVELTRTETGKVFRIQSVLPVLPEVQESGCDRCLSADPARREMFFKVMRSTEQLQQLMHRWPGTVFSQRPDGTFYFVSPKVEDLTGIPASEWERSPSALWSVVHEADAPAVRESLRQSAAGKTAVSQSFRVRNVRNGRISYLLEHRQAVRTRSGLLLGYEGVWLDVTHQRLIENRLNAAAWKETLASLTLGLAHDFRNLMAGIISITETFQSQLDKQHPFQQGFELILSSAWHATHSVQRIAQLYHGKGGDRAYADVNELVREIGSLSERMLSRRIQFRSQVFQGQLPAYLDGFEFRQAFLNLIVNARDAMPEGGQLTVRTTRHEAFPRMDFVRGKLPRLPALCVEVADTGCGIAAEHLESIFDPFFTTKGIEKGSGLGLYTVFCFVEKHHGAVSVESRPGAGAVFRIWLPEADFTEGERELEKSRQGAKLLLFGDEPEALEAMADLLRKHEIETTIAFRAEEAWEMLRNPGSAVSAVLMQSPAKHRGFFADIRREQLPVKTILQIVGCESEQEQDLLAHADLVLPAEVMSSQIPAQIRSLLPLGHAA